MTFTCGRGSPFRVPTPINAQCRIKLLWLRCSAVFGFGKKREVCVRAVPRPTDAEMSGAAAIMPQVRP